MRRAACLLYVLLPLLLACGAGGIEGASSPDDVQEGVDLASAKLRLRGEGDHLSLTGAGPADAGALFYVLDPKADPSGVHRPVGVVEVSASEPGKVMWSCKPRVEVGAAALSGPGLPALPVSPGTRLHAGKCLGTYFGQAPEAWDRSSKAMVYLLLSVGTADGVRPGDTFDVLGNPEGKGDGRSAAHFERIGRCAIQELDLAERAAVCRLVRSQWPAFGREAWTAGGFVKIATEHTVR